MASKLIQQGQGRLAKAPELDPAADDRAPVPAPSGTIASQVDALDVSAIPELHAPVADGEQLTRKEQQYLARCEAALVAAGKAFVAAGKALSSIREGRLYRGTHSSFEQYVEEVWDISRATANRWIDAWPLGKALPKANERQVRPLIPMSRTFGEDAAITVYKAVDDAGKVTADVMAGVVAVLPQDSFEPEEVIQQIRAYLAGELKPPAPAPADPVQMVTGETAKFLRVLQRKADDIRAARRSNPEAIREAAANLRAMAAELEGDQAE